MSVARLGRVPLLLFVHIWRWTVLLPLFHCSSLPFFEKIEEPNMLTLSLMSVHASVQQKRVWQFSAGTVLCRVAFRLIDTLG